MHRNQEVNTPQVKTENTSSVVPFDKKSQVQTRLLEATSDVLQNGKSSRKKTQYPFFCNCILTVLARVVSWSCTWKFSSSPQTNPRASHNLQETLRFHIRTRSLTSVTD